MHSAARERVAVINARFSLSPSRPGVFIYEPVFISIFRPQLYSPPSTPQRNNSDTHAEEEVLLAPARTLSWVGEYGRTEPPPASEEGRAVVVVAVQAIDSITRIIYYGGDYYLRQCLTLINTAVVVFVVVGGWVVRSLDGWLVGWLVKQTGTAVAFKLLLYRG